MAKVPRATKTAATAHRPHAGPCRGLIGVRCSTDEQLDRYGPEVQRQACMTIAASEGLDVDPDADVVVISQSVTKYVGAADQAALDGDFYAAIIDRLKTGRYCAYVTYDMTRLTRSGVLHQLLLEQEVHRHVPRIHYANLAGVDTTTPEGETFKVIMAAVNRLRTVLDLARLAAAKRRQAHGGHWAGETVPLGYALEVDHEETARRKRATYRRVPYRPHADVVVAMLRALVDQRGNPFRAARALRRAGVVVPDFDAERAPLMTSRSIIKVLRTRVEGGWAITPRMVAAAARSPVYEGALVWEGETIRREERLAIVDADLLGEARRALEAVSVKPRGRGASMDGEPLALADLLYCAGHQDDPHPHPIRARCKSSGQAYRCVDGFERGVGSVCLELPARVIDDPVAQFVFAELRFGAVADDVIAELERERADGAARAAERQQDRRRLTREIATLEANIDTVLQSEVLSTERYERMERTLERKRAEVAALVDEPVTPISRQLDARQAATVRELLDNLDAHWPRMSGADRNDLLGVFVERVELAHRGASLVARVRWISGQTQTIAIERPNYQPNGLDTWTAEEEVILRERYGRVAWEEMLAALPRRTRRAIVKRAAALGLAGVCRPLPRGRRRAFTGDEDALMRRYAAGDLNLDEVRGLTGRTDQSVYGRLIKMGLQRSAPRSRPTVAWRPVPDTEHEHPNGECCRTPAFEVLEFVLSEPTRARRLTELAGGAAAGA